MRRKYSDFVFSLDIKFGKISNKLYYIKLALIFSALKQSNLKMLSGAATNDYLPINLLIIFFN